MKNLILISTRALHLNIMLGLCLTVLILFGATNLFAQAELTGTYTIGSDADYETFAAAVADLHANGISGPVTFQVNPGTYTERFVLKEISGASENDTIKFVSATGSAADVILTNSATSADDNYIVKLDSADYITFEKMTFTTEGTEFCTIFNILNEASHNNILDNILNGVASTTTNFSASLIQCDQYSTGVHFNPDSILVSGNTFNNGGIGIYVHGYSLSGARIEMFDVVKNTFNNQYYRAVYLRAVIHSAIKTNVISANTSGTNIFGVHLSECDGNMAVIDNTINISSNGDARGMQIDNLYATGETESIIVANNMVSSVGTSDVHGIETYNCNHIFFYYNTLVTDGGTINYTFSERSHISNYGPVNIVNNIFINKSENYAFYVEQDEGNPDYMGTVDFNDYFTTGSNIAFWGTTAAADLAALRALNGQDANSVSKAVTFVSSTDLHLAGASLGDTELTGTPVDLVDRDIDDDARSVSLPYMGADENTDNPLPVELVSFTATIRNNALDLKWSTATETNNYGFNIERREREQDWQTLGFVKGFGTSSTQQSYTFTDNTVTNSYYAYRLKQIDVSGTFTYSEVIKIPVSLFPAEYHLAQNFPNPFNPSTTISYSIKQTGYVQLAIYDELGRLTRTLVSRNQSAGVYTIAWDGKDNNGNLVSSGAYFSRLRSGENDVISKQMLMLK